MDQAGRVVLSHPLHQVDQEVRFLQAVQVGLGLQVDRVVQQDTFGNWWFVEGRL